MGQKLGADIIPTPTKVSGTSVQNTGTQRVTVGGQQYVSTSTLTINTATTGAGGLDTGSLSTNQLWYIHYVVSGGALALLASLSKTAPTGFSTAFTWSGYAFTTDNSSAVLAVGTLQSLVIFRALTSGSGTYTPNTGCTRMDIEMCAGGGGGSGGGNTSTQFAGGNGTSTTFGSSLLTCNGGSGGGNNGLGGNGGGFSIAASLQSTSFGYAGSKGGPGQGAIATNGAWVVGGHGGTNPFGNAGAGVSTNDNSGTPATANTGAGGGGGNGASTGSNCYGGAGGGAGGWIRSTIHNPNTIGPFSYSIGSGGNGGNPGTAGQFAGGNGASGVIYVRESFA